MRKLSTNCVCTRGRDLVLLCLGVMLVLSGCAGCSRTLQVEVRDTAGATAFTTVDSKTVVLYGVKDLLVPGESDEAKECFQHARDLLKTKTMGKTLKVIVKGETAQNGKEGVALHGLVYLPDGEMLNETIITEGYGYVDEQELKNDPEKLKRFLDLQEKARLEKKGAWKYWADKQPS